METFSFKSIIQKPCQRKFQLIITCGEMSLETVNPEPSAQVFCSCSHYFYQNVCSSLPHLALLHLSISSLHQPIVQKLTSWVIKTYHQSWSFDTFLNVWEKLKNLISCGWKMIHMVYYIVNSLSKSNSRVINF